MHRKCMFYAIKAGNICYTPSKGRKTSIREKFIVTELFCVSDTGPMGLPMVKVCHRTLLL